MSGYPSSVRITMPVSLKDIREAFEFVCAGGGGEHQAFLCKQSGKLYCHSDLCDDLDILPNDIDDTEKFLQIPDKKELDLGKPLALDFRPPIPARRLRRRSTIFQQKGRLRQIQGSVGSKGRARSVVRFRGESRGKSLEDVVRS
jgi:hypothetical protein